MSCTYKVTCCLLIFQHYLISATKSTCFMVILTRDEQDHVHTSLGIEDLEVSYRQCMVHIMFLISMTLLIILSQTMIVNMSRFNRTVV